MYNALKFKAISGSGGGAVQQDRLGLWLPEKWILSEGGWDVAEKFRHEDITKDDRLVKKMEDPPLDIIIASRFNPNFNLQLQEYHFNN